MATRSTIFGAAVLVVALAGTGCSAGASSSAAVARAHADQGVAAAAATAKPTVQVSLSGGSRLTVKVRPKRSDGYRFVLQRKEAGRWQVQGRHRTKGKKTTRSFRVDDGRYRVVVKKTKETSRTVSSSYRYVSRGSGGTTAADPLNSYFIDSTLCEGIDCGALPLGDDRMSTTTPAVGGVYSCVGKNPSAPGSDSASLTWVDFAAGQWSFLTKPWLPTVSGAKGSYSENVAGGVRIIASNDLPSDGSIGDWPMTQYPLLSAIDANPGVPAAQSVSYRLSASPGRAAAPSCLPLGAIAVAKNGVVLFSAVDARGDDAVAHEIVDAAGGHPARDQYHYHFVPQQLEDAAQRLADGHSGIVAYALDGFPLYGYYGVGGKRVGNNDLDECHGHEHGGLGYHYHATLAYPYTLGCFRGTPVS